MTGPIVLRDDCAIVLAGCGHYWQDAITAAERVCGVCDRLVPALHLTVWEVGAPGSEVVPGGGGPEPPGDTPGGVFGDVAQR